MPIHAPVGSSEERERPEPGTYNSVCQSVHDVGVQKSKAGELKHKIVIVWEINETMKNGEFAGKRFVVSSTFNLSLFKGSWLRKALISWRGKDFTTDEDAEAFDIEKVIGKPCMITIAEKESGDRTYTNVTGISKLPKEMSAITPELPPNHVFKWIEKMKMNAVQEQKQQQPALQKITPATEDDLQKFSGDSDPFAADPDDSIF